MEPERIAEILAQHVACGCDYKPEHCRACWGDVPLPCETYQLATLAAEATRLREALEEERRKFQRETLRTSAQAQLLARAEAVLCNNHSPGPWDRGCERCALVGEMQTLRETPINQALATGQEG